MLALYPLSHGVEAVQSKVWGNERLRRPGELHSMPISSYGRHFSDEHSNGGVADSISR